MAKEKNYWLHRISHEWELSYSLLEKGYLSIGWNYYSKNPEVLSLARENDSNLFDKFMKDNDTTSRSRWNLWRFARFQKGDIIVVPLFDKKFSIYEVEEVAIPIQQIKLNEVETKNGKMAVLKDEGYYVDNELIDLGFVVKVEKIFSEKPRSWADPKLIARMKIRQANAELIGFENEINNAIKAKEPASLYGKLISNLNDSVTETLSQVITPCKLELLIQWYMYKKGASYVYIPSKNEKGKENGADADVIAHFEDLGIIYYIQAKNHKKDTETSSWAVTQIKEYYEQKRDLSDEFTYIPWVISSSNKFSEDAINEAKSKGVRLIDKDEFIKMLLNVGIEDIDNAFIDKKNE